MGSAPGYTASDATKERMLTCAPQSQVVRVAAHTGHRSSWAQGKALAARQAARAAAAGRQAIQSGDAGGSGY
jgi:hypothetical protein